MRHVVTDPPRARLSGWVTCPASHLAAQKISRMSLRKPDFNAAGTSWWQGERSEASAISEEDLKTLWSDVFERMDTDQSGTVDSHEIANATGRMSSQVRELVAKADRNQDNEVSRDEWDLMLREVLEQVGMPGPSVLDEMRSFAKGEPLKCGVGFAKQPHGN